MSTTPEVEQTPVTRTCAAGNHLRCLGTVWSAQSAGLVPCGCAVEKCGHGSDTAKARRKRGD